MCYLRVLNRLEWHAFRREPELFQVHMSNISLRLTDQSCQGGDDCIGRRQPVSGLKLSNSSICTCTLSINHVHTEVSSWLGLAEVQLYLDLSTNCCANDSRCSTTAHQVGKLSRNNLKWKTESGVIAQTSAMSSPIEIIATAMHVRPTNIQ